MVGIHRNRVHGILDADIQGVFDHVSHAWLVRFVEHRSGDMRVIRLIQQWLTAGVLAEGGWPPSEEGVPQGGLISPVLANISLHDAFDLWAHAWRKRNAHGEVIVVRYADDLVRGFEHRAEAGQFREELSARLAKFDLTLHADKTRLLECGRFAVRNCGRRGHGTPPTFDFLGFTHICGQATQGRFIVRRQTMQKRLRAKLQAIKAALRRRRHDPLPQQGRWLRSVLLGHDRYDGVPLNRQALAAFRAQVMRLWTQALRRRSQQSRGTRTRRSRLERKWLPAPHIYHPVPWQRLHVIT
jgi:group II intron reverse transcriptase/maturase